MGETVSLRKEGRINRPIFLGLWSRMPSPKRERRKSGKKIARGQRAQRRSLQGKGGVGVGGAAGPAAPPSSSTAKQMSRPRPGKDPVWALKLTCMGVRVVACCAIKPRAQPLPG